MSQREEKNYNASWNWGNFWWLDGSAGGDGGGNDHPSWTKDDSNGGVEQVENDEKNRNNNVTVVLDDKKVERSLQIVPQQEQYRAEEVRFLKRRMQTDILRLLQEFQKFSNKWNQKPEATNMKPLKWGDR